MASNKNQHYVPQCYLRQFSADNSTSAINLFNIDREKFVNCAPLKKQCSRSYFYGDDLELEKALQPIEGRYAGIVREITNQNCDLTDEHREFLKFFWRLQYMRTEAASRRSIEMTDGMGEVAGLEPEDFKMEMKEAVQLSMRNFVQENYVMNDLKVCLIKNKTIIDFITSDDPAVLTNKWHFLDKRTSGSNFGLGSAGVIIFLPITPRILCVGFDPNVYSIPHKKGWVDVRNEREVNLFNEHQYLNSRANIFYQDRNSKAQILASFALVKSSRPKARHKINYAILDRKVDGSKRYKVVDWREAQKHEEAIIHTEMVNPTPEKQAVCEIYARIGRLKGSQPDKVASDLLKLCLLEQLRGGAWRKILCFACPEAAKTVMGKSWLSAAAKYFGVEIHVVSIPENDRELLLAAQSRQLMINK